MRRSNSHRSEMKHAKFAAAFLLGLFVSCTLASGFAAASSTPFRYLSLTPLPPDLPTSSGSSQSFPALVVALTDQQGNPTVAPNDTTVYLTSANPAVLSVVASVVIKGGDQYAVADVSTTPTPGNTTVTAVAPGLEAASATFTTSVPRGFPTQLQLYALPATFPSGKQVNSNFTVIVEDAAGLPARTIQNEPIQVTSSDTNILSAGNAQIPANKTIGYGSISTSGVPGSASITASAQGLVSSTTVVTVIGGAGAPVHLMLSAPVNLPADGGSYSVLTVSLQDNASRPAAAKSLVQVYLTSSRPDIASVPQSVTIAQGSSFTNVDLKTAAASGTAFITASALNFTASTLQLSTVSIPPTKLGMYLADSKALVSPVADTLGLVVQLQDSQGLPAEARAPASVILSFSNTTLLQAPVTLTIPKGTDLVYANLTLARGTVGTFTAISNGLESVSAAFSASSLAITNTLGSSSQTIHTNQTATIYYTLRFQGLPLSGATLVWSSTDGTVSSASSTTDASGEGTATFSPAATGEASVTVVATSPLVGKVNATAYVLVIAYPPAKQVSLVDKIFGPILNNRLYLIAFVGAIVAVVVVLVVVIRRRRGGSAEDEDSFSIGPSPGEGTAFDLRA